MFNFKNLSSFFTNQKGAAPLLLMVVVIGLVAFVVGSSTVSFNKGLFAALFPKDNSQAATPVSGVVQPSNITIYATGTPGFNVSPIMVLKINGVAVKTFSVTANAYKGQIFQYKYQSNTKINPDQVKLEFTNDMYATNNDRNLGVDKINIDGVDFQTEDQGTFSIGSWDSASGCGTGFKKSEWLVCNGYFQYRASVAVTPGGVLPAQDKDYTLQVGDLQRTYQVHYPPAYAISPSLPVVIAYHGGAGNISHIKQMTGLNAFSDKNNFIVVYPQGMGAKDSATGQYLGSWNAGSCCEDGKKLSTADDIGFISKMIDQLKVDYRVDADRIYATGASNGSMMTFKTGCELSDKIAAIGSGIAPGLMEPCTTKPVPVFYFHGTADRCAPYNGMMSGDCAEVFINTLFGTKITLPRWPIDSAPGYMTKWKAHNGVPGDGILIYQNKSASCKSSGYYSPNEVVFCTIVGMGHTWPGQKSYGDNCAKGPTDPVCKATMASAGPLNSDMIANDHIWNFFLRHPKP